jgi:hypothetical protein
MNKYVTCVGSRETPTEICNLMTKIASKLEQEGYILRSGRAIGADLAFEKGIRNSKNKCIYTIENFDFSPENYEMCKSEILSILDSNLNFDNYGKNAQILILRDVNQVLGSIKTELVKSKFLICWTKHLNYYAKPPNACGGTRFAVRIALKHGIPVFNLLKKEDRERIEKFLS